MYFPRYPLAVRAAVFSLVSGLLFYTATGQTPATGADLWAEFAASPDDHSHLPNAAYAGYRCGEASVPDVPVVVNVLDHGAVNDGTGDNTRAFREAIDAAWYAGGGAVFVPAGTYRVERMLLLHRDGVVLRGAGQGETIIDFANPLINVLGSTGHGSQHWNWTGGLVWIGPRDLFEVRHDGRWTQSRDAAPGFNVNAGNWEAWRNEGVITEVTSTHPRGVRSVDVADASDLAPGDFVLMTWDNPGGDLLWKEIARHAVFDGYNFGDWLEATPYFGWPVEIASVEGNTVSFARPTRVSVEPGYNTALRRIGPSVREAGIESMTLRMANTRETYSYNDGVGWNGVFFNRAFNCWARDLEIIDAENPLHLSSSANVSVLDIATEGAMQAKYVFTNRVMSHDVLYDGFDIRNTGVLTNGINTEWLGTGNVWTRGNMDTGTFDSHRLMSFDYLRTDITMRNPAGSRPGGAAQAGPFTGNRAVHWNIRVEDSDRPANSRGQWVYHPIQYTYGAQIGISGAAMYTAGDSNPWAMPGGDKNMRVGDEGVEPSPANLFDAQVGLRRETEAWAVLASPSGGFLSTADPVLRADGNPSADGGITAFRFHVNDDLAGEVTEAPYAFEWTDAVPGRHTVRVELVDAHGGSTWSRPYDVVVGERVRIEHNDPRILYGGPWSVESHPEFSAGQARASDGVGERHFEIVFRGTRVRWFTRHNNHRQSVTVRLNGFEVGSVNVHGGQTYCRHLGWDSGELPEGIYTLRISTTNRLVLDHLEITSTDGAEGEPAPPDAPGNLTASPVSPSEVDLLWTRGSNNEQGFHVERRESGAAEWTRVATIGAAFTSFADTGLDHGVTYEYRVQAYNIFGESDYSEIVTVTAPEPVTAPAAPSDLAATNVTHNRVDLEWANNANDHEGFEIERMAAFGSWERVATLPLTATTWIDIGLSPETTCQYRVRAFNSAGASAFSNIVEVTTDAFSETAGNLFPESWFLQAVDGTGSITANQPDHVAFEGETGSQYRGAVARLNESTTLAAEGDFISFEFTTDNVTAGNNIGFTIRFGLYDDGGSPVTEDHSSVTDGSTGFFAATGNRTTDGRPTDIYAQGAGSAQILARGADWANNLSAGGVSRRAHTQTANAGNRTATFLIQRLDDGALRVSLDMVDAANRVIYLVDDVPASAVPTYTFNQVAVSLGGHSETGMDFTEMVLRRGGPSFDEAPPAAPFDAWLADNFTEAERSDPAISGPLADPTGQGMANLQRHAFGLARNEPVAPAVPEIVMVDDGDSRYFLVSHLRNEEASDVIVTVQASLDLDDWSGFTGLIEPKGEPEPTGRPGVVRLTHRVQLPANTSETFLRIAVELSEPTHP